MSLSYMVEAMGSGHHKKSKLMQ